MFPRRALPLRARVRSNDGIPTKVRSLSSFLRNRSGLFCICKRGSVRSGVFARLGNLLYRPNEDARAISRYYSLTRGCSARKEPVRWRSSRKVNNVTLHDIPLQGCTMSYQFSTALCSPCGMYINYQIAMSRKSLNPVGTANYSIRLVRMTCDSPLNAKRSPLLSEKMLHLRQNQRRTRVKLYVCLNRRETVSGFLFDNRDTGIARSEVRKSVMLLASAARLRMAGGT